MIKLRIDVDYPFAHRAKSFLYVALRIKNIKSKDYLKNAIIIAKMINQSPNDVKAYWFFTPYTIPNKELLDLLHSERHEIALHVATKPFEEWKILENKTNWTVKYYTIHGTQRVFAQLLWGRKLNQNQAVIPTDFPLTSFHDLMTMSLDRTRYLMGLNKVVEEAKSWIKQGIVMSLHPEWLFNVMKKSQRGPYYDALKSILDVDHDLSSISTRKAFSIKIARDYNEYQKNVTSNAFFLRKLQDRGFDIFTFIERKWCCPIVNPSKYWAKTNDNIALLEIKDYTHWWSAIGKKTRNMVRKAEKGGVKISVEPQSNKLAEGIWKIYNETPIRQGRAFPHFGETLEAVTDNMYSEKNSTFLAAFIGQEIAGFIQILYGNEIALLSNILSMQKHWDKSVNNALLAKAVEVCASKGERWLMYGRIGNHPSLDRFKENNGFVKYPLTRFYIPLTRNGRLAIRLGLHQELKDALPHFIKAPIIPVFNWISRTKAQLS